MKNSLSDLNNNLFEALERLNDAATPEEIEREIERAQAVADIGEVIVRNASVGLKAIDIFGREQKVPELLRIEK